MKRILGFSGEYEWLSNFYEKKVFIFGETFLNREVAYQSQKDPSRRKEFTSLSARDAKKLGRKVTIREDWEEEKEFIMEEILRAYFLQNKDESEKLIATGNSYIEETNYWKDTFWGVCEGEGLNRLGKLLMKIREEIR